MIEVSVSIISAYGFLKQRPVLEYMRHPIWKPLFEFYNKHNENKLGMGCAPCYPKVLGFIKKSIEDAANNITSAPPPKLDPVSECDSMGGNDIRTDRVLAGD